MWSYVLNRAIASSPAILSSAATWRGSSLSADIRSLCSWCGTACSRHGVAAAAKVLRAVLSTALILMAVLAALAGCSRSNIPQGTQTAACAQAGTGIAPAEDLDQENPAAR
jgi:hypothetical protein